MLEDKIYKDYVKAAKSQEKVKREFLSFLRASFKNKAIELKTDKLDDGQVISVLKKEKKKLQETREFVERAGKIDQLPDIQKEVEIVDSYLPQPLSQEEVVRIIDEVIDQEQASSLKDMGKVIKRVLEQISARADSKQVSQIVRERLNNPN